MSGFTPVQVPQCSCRLLYHHIRDGHPWDRWFPDPWPYSQNSPWCPPPAPMAVFRRPRYRHGRNRENRF